MRKFRQRQKGLLFGDLQLGHQYQLSINKQNSRNSQRSTLIISTLFPLNAENFHPTPP